MRPWIERWPLATRVTVASTRCFALRLGLLLRLLRLLRRLRSSRLLRCGLRRVFLRDRRLPSRVLRVGHRTEERLVRRRRIRAAIGQAQGNEIEPAGAVRHSRRHRPFSAAQLSALERPKRGSVHRLARNRRVMMWKHRGDGVRNRLPVRRGHRISERVNAVGLRARCSRIVRREHVALIVGAAGQHNRLVRRAALHLRHPTRWSVEAHPPRRIVPRPRERDASNRHSNTDNGGNLQRAHKRFLHVKLEQPSGPESRDEMGVVKALERRG